MTPSFPTFFMASAMMLPNLFVVVSADCTDLGDHVALTSRDSRLISATATSTALSDCRAERHRTGSAATVRTPSRKSPEANRVAVVCHRRPHRGFGTRPAHHLRAHILQRVLQLDLLGHVTPSLVMIGAPNFFSITALRPFGPT